MSKSNVKELGENELLLELAYLDQAEYIDKQVCVQLRKIVKWYFDEGIQQIIGDLKKTEDWQLAKPVMTGKRVTRKDIVKLAQKVNFTSPNFNEHIIRITAWLQELGIEVGE